MAFCHADFFCAANASDCWSLDIRKREADETEADETEADETEADETEADETGADETEADETEADETEAGRLTELEETRSAIGMPKSYGSSILTICFMICSIFR